MGLQIRLLRKNEKKLHEQANSPLFGLHKRKKKKKIFQSR